MPRSRSLCVVPCSVSETVLAFSSTMKSPWDCSSISESLPSTMVAARVSLGMIRLTFSYIGARLSALGSRPEMISGVRASSIRIESTSSTIA